MNTNVGRNYLENEVYSAPKCKLIIMLYDKILQSLRAGKEFLKNKDLVGAHNNILKSESIIMELMIHLNMKAGKISKNLYQLYEFILWKLKEANIKKSIVEIEEVYNIIVELKEAWEKVLLSEIKVENRHMENVNLSI